MLPNKTWILDIVIKDGDYIWSSNEVENGMWLVVSCDGAPQPFSTNQVAFSDKPQWEFPFRLCLEFHDIGKSYLYFTLCSFQLNGQGIRPVARSRIGLYSMPIGSPKQFSFPLYHAMNSACKVITLRVIATLSAITAPTYQPFDDFLLLPSSGNFSIDNFPTFM